MACHVLSPDHDSNHSAHHSRFPSDLRRLDFHFRSSTRLCKKVPDLHHSCRSCFSVAPLASHIATFAGTRRAMLHMLSSQPDKPTMVTLPRFSSPYAPAREMSFFLLLVVPRMLYPTSSVPLFLISEAPESGWRGRRRRRCCRWVRIAS